MIKLSANHIKRLAEINCFAIPKNEMFFFGLRGCIPVSDDSQEFKNEHFIELITYDHIHPRCTIGQFHHEKGIALFPGSTVPHQRNIKRSLERGGNGANMLLTGYYNDYRKGRHKAGKPTGHNAFRQDNKLPVRRTADDLDYDNDDRVEYTRPYDNLHAGWCMGTDHDYFASAGCQVIAGYPKCTKRNDSPDTGPWRTFKSNAYSLDQQNFNYMLLNGRDAQKITCSNGQKQPARLRFGSKGKLVSTVQQKLKDLEYYEGKLDDDFGPRTLHALLEFQEDYFGHDADDGIVGQITASALKISWPLI
ncbi:peptidoglycan-binding domain-containing protein [Carboxylicivirga sp. RSCT41]|uniref:peptidoglycan-binding domain-containing protein n=1 Tax=Carboxylicivirga agarovorans TaxID=3417570 RepID=UPI003D33E04F